jgi:hypothetical protein
MIELIEADRAVDLFSQEHFGLSFLLPNIIVKNHPSISTFLARSIPPACVLTVLFAATLPAQAAIIWNGPTISFSKAAFANPALPGNQDRLTSDVWLTRGSSAGLYNAALETGFTSFSSPANTEWSYGTLANYASLTYTNWEGWFGGPPPGGGGPGSTVGKDAVLHLISDDIYLSIKFTSFGSSGGAFSYNRSTPSVVPEASSVAILTAGLMIFLFRRGAKALRHPTRAAPGWTESTNYPTCRR